MARAALAIINKIAIANYNKHGVHGGVAALLPPNF